MNEFLLLAVIMIYLAISYWPTPNPLCVSSNELAELRIDLARQSRNQKRDTYLTPKHTKSTKFTIKKYPDPFVSFANFVVRKSFVEWRIADKLRWENLRRPSAAKPQLNKRHRKSPLTSPPSRGRAERGPRHCCK